jgi:hypothetical protein
MTGFIRGLAVTLGFFVAYLMAVGVGIGIVGAIASVIA